MEGRRMFYLVLLCGLLLPLTGSAQNLCEGNLGENIFEAGDFGTGFPNILTPDPNIAPGYVYTTNVPPNDGSYTVTNNTSSWAALWPSWLRIADNSNDPYGYMMVVNASFSPGIFFEQTITGLCENTSYEFSADIINMIKVGITGHIKPNVSFLLNDELQYSTGEIDQTDAWNTYGFTFDTEVGQTSIKLTLSNNAPGGIGNDLALDNISFRACGPSAFINTEQNIFLCFEDNQPAAITADLDLNTNFVQWQLSLDQGFTWNDIPGETGQTFLHQEFQPGIYYYRYLSATSDVNLSNFKCRVISDVIVLEVLPQFYQASDTVCLGQAYFFGSDTLTEDGTYTATLTSSRGCDSIVTLDLRFVDSDLSFDFATVDPFCPGDENGSINILNIQNGVEPISYFLDGLEVPSSVIPDLGAGTYELRIRDRFLCIQDTQATLLEPEPFAIDIGPDLELDFGESASVRLQSTGTAATISWTPVDWLSCVDCDRTEIVGVQDQSYFITAEDERGCMAFDTLQVLLKSDELRLFIPNVFSPNGDGVNDYFQIFAFDQTVQSIESLRVFDRWGGVVYEANDFEIADQQATWDGRIEGDWAAEGIYVYLFQLRLIDGRLIEKAGSLMVMY